MELCALAKAISGGLNMAHTFISLLNDGSYNEAEEISYSPTPPFSQEHSQQAPNKPKKGRSKNFLIEEDMLLLFGWLNISTDPVQGNNQTQTTYWNRILSYFHKNKRFESDRTPTSLCNRWSAINTSVSKFIGFYNQISGRNQSGVTEQDKVGQAMDMYESIMKKKIPFIRQWHELRHSPKYAASLAKKTKTTLKDNQPCSPSTESPLSTNHGVESEEGMERPIGRKAAKKMKRAAYEATDVEILEILKSMQKEALVIASSRSESVNMSLQLQKKMMKMQKEEQERQKEIILLQKEKLQLRLAKEERERHKEERERHVYKASIMAMDTSKMAPDQAKYYDALKTGILRNIS